MTEGDVLLRIWRDCIWATQCSLRDALTATWRNRAVVKDDPADLAGWLLGSAIRLPHLFLENFIRTTDIHLQPATQFKG